MHDNEEKPASQAVGLAPAIPRLGGIRKRDRIALIAATLSGAVAVVVAGVGLHHLGGF